MNRSPVRFVQAWMLAAAVIGCGGSQGDSPTYTVQPDQGGGDSEPQTGDAVVHGDELVRPSYSGRELERAILVEKGAIADLETAITSAARRRDDGDGAAFDDWARASENAAVRRRLLATLVACRDHGETCPPKLDDPGSRFDLEPAIGAFPLAGEFRFDLASWQKTSRDLANIACACRTLVCVDGMYETIRLMETRPTREVQDDELSTQWVTHARACLGRLKPRWRNGRAN